MDAGINGKAGMGGRSVRLLHDEGLWTGEAQALCLSQAPSRAMLWSPCSAIIPTCLPISTICSSEWALSPAHFPRSQCQWRRSGLAPSLNEVPTTLIPLLCLCIWPEPEALECHREVSAYNLLISTEAEKIKRNPTLWERWLLLKCHAHSCRGERPKFLWCVSQESRREAGMQFLGNCPPLHEQNLWNQLSGHHSQSLPLPVSNTPVDLFRRIFTQTDKLSFCIQNVLYVSPI